MPVQSIPITDRSSWLEMRHQDVTASVVGALVGVHEYLTPYKLWAQKTGRLTVPDEETKAMRRGRLLEPVAAAMIAEDNPAWDVRAPNVYLRDPAKRKGCTPDLFVDHPERGPGIVQVKTTMDFIFRQKWRDANTAEIVVPTWIALQAMMEADLSGREWAQVGVLVVGMGLDIFLAEVPIHKGALQRIDDEIGRFWDMVERDEAPEADFYRDAETLSKIFNDGSDPPIDLTGDNRFAALIARRIDLKADIKAWQQELEPVETEIKYKLGNHEAAHCGNHIVTWKTQHRKGYSVAPATFRTLRIT